MSDQDYSYVEKKDRSEIYSEDDASDPFLVLAQEEESHDIKYRTLSWQKAAVLLFGEYVCLAILALSWSWSVLGWVSLYSPLTILSKPAKKLIILVC